MRISDYTQTDTLYDADLFLVSDTSLSTRTIQFEDLVNNISSSLSSSDDESDMDAIEATYVSYLFAMAEDSMEYIADEFETITDEELEALFA